MLRMRKLFTAQAEVNMVLILRQAKGRYTGVMSKLPAMPTCSEAENYASVWRRAGPELDAKRLQELRSLSEEDAARRFAELLTAIGEVPMRSSSGLVEQQRLLARMREQGR